MKLAKTNSPTIPYIYPNKMYVSKGSDTHNAVQFDFNPCPTIAQKQRRLVNNYKHNQTYPCLWLAERNWRGAFWVC